jgi:hypothetical protein
VSDVTPALEPRELTDTETGEVEAASVVLNRSAARQVTATDASLSDSAAVFVEARGSVSMQNSASVQVLTESAALVNSPVFFVGAERARLTDSPVFLFLGRAEDDVQATLDWRGAIALGAAFGIGLAVAGAVLARIGRR